MGMTNADELFVPELPGGTGVEDEEAEMPEVTVPALQPFTSVAHSAIESLDAKSVYRPANTPPPKVGMTMSAEPWIASTATLRVPLPLVG